MILLPIDIDDSLNNRFRDHAECSNVLDVYVEYYKKIGFHLPWVGYFATADAQSFAIDKQNLSMGGQPLTIDGHSPMTDTQNLSTDAQTLTINGQTLVGCGGYKGQPRAGMVEVAYGTFKGFEGKGIATAICRELVGLSLRTDPGITITARTLQENYASHKVLSRNQFICKGIIWDEEDGEVFEWVYEP